MGNVGSWFVAWRPTTSEQEQWKEIPTIAVVPRNWRPAAILGANCGYWSNVDGRIRGPNGKDIKVLKDGRVTVHGWLRIAATLNCWTWHGEPPHEMMCARFEDGDKRNVAPRNLYWGVPVGQCRTPVVFTSAEKEYRFAGLRLGERALGLGHGSAKSLRSGYRIRRAV